MKDPFDAYIGKMPNPMIPSKTDLLNCCYLYSDWFSIFLPDALGVSMFVKNSARQHRIFARVNLSIIGFSVEGLSTLDIFDGKCRQRQNVENYFEFLVILITSFEYCTHHQILQQSHSNCQHGNGLITLWGTIIKIACLHMVHNYAVSPQYIH
jgi:hypothetical protein